MAQTVLIFSVGKRKETAAKVQGILTDYARCIKTRIGLHDPSSDGGLIVLELIGKKEDNTKLSDALAHVEGIKSQLVTL